MSCCSRACAYSSLSSTSCETIGLTIGCGRAGDAARRSREAGHCDATRPPNGTAAEKAGRQAREFLRVYCCALCGCRPRFLYTTESRCTSWSPRAVGPVSMPRPSRLPNRTVVKVSYSFKLNYQKQHLTLVPLRPEPCTLAVRPSRGSHIGQDCPSARLERPSSSAEWPSAVVVLGRRRIGAAAACPGSSGVRVRARSRRYRQRR